MANYSNIHTAVARIDDVYRTRHAEHPAVSLPAAMNATNFLPFSFPAPCIINPSPEGGVSFEYMQPAFRLLVDFGNGGSVILISQYKDCITRVWDWNRYNRMSLLDAFRKAQRPGSPGLKRVAIAAH